MNLSASRGGTPSWLLCRISARAPSHRAPAIDQDERIAHRFGSNLVYWEAEVILSSKQHASRPSDDLPGRSAAAVHGRDWLLT